MMRLFLCGAAAALLLASPAALAQSDQSQSGQKPDKTTQQQANPANNNTMQGPNQGPNGGSMSGPNRRHNGSMSGPNGGSMRGPNQATGGSMSGPNKGGAMSGPNTRERNVNVNRNVNVKRNVDVNRRVNVNRNVNVRRHVDVTRFRRAVRATRHFHVRPYRAPRGYVYRRWSVGARLPAIFFARDHWLFNFSIYGLVTPPPGYVWVRFGPDALLIDETTGEVIQVQYGIFI